MTRNIPQSIKDINNWSVFNNGKIKLLSYGECIKIKRNQDRLGFLIKQENNIIGIVIKNAIKYNKIKDEYLDIIKSFNTTYIERRGNDVTILCQGLWNHNTKNYNDIEIVKNNKYVILTGNVLYRKSDITNCRKAINNLREYFDDNL